MINFLKFKSGFSKNVLTLMTGATIAQAIPIAISPILTRLYTPSDFGVLSLFLAISSILAVIATLRYELAIVQPQADEDAAAIVVLSASIAIIISLITFIFIYLSNSTLKSLISNPEIEPWLYLIPLSVLLTGLYQSLNYWHSRKKLFKQIAKSKVHQGIGSGIIQASSGFAQVGSKALIWGYLLGQIIALVTLLIKFLKSDVKIVKQVSYRSVRANATLYKDLPLYSTFGALADKLSVQMPILIISKFFDLIQTGIFSLTFRVLSFPMSLMSNALYQVLFQKVSVMYYESPGKIKILILKISFLLFLIMIPFVGIIWLYGEDIFIIIFGNPWRQSGEMAAILSLAIAIRFIVSPLTAVLALGHNIKMGVLWQITYLVTVTITLIYFSSYDINTLLYAFVIHDLVLYTIYFIFIINGAGNNIRCA